MQEQQTLIWVLMKLIFNQLDPAMSTEFVGYTNYSYAGAKVLAIVSNDAVVDTASEGDKVSIVVDKTPFYAEMGGQVGDCGTMHNDNAILRLMTVLSLVAISLSIQVLLKMVRLRLAILLTLILM